MARAVFLDRDGVLNFSEVRDQKPYAPRRVEDFHLYPEIYNQLQRLKTAGFLLVVVTNQPDIGNGLVGLAQVEAMHAKLLQAAPIDKIYLCPHSQSDNCECRKPKPGMLLAAAAHFRIDLVKSFIVGDRASDIAAGRDVGCKSVFIDRGYKEKGPEISDVEVISLTKAVDYILAIHTGRQLIVKGGRHVTTR